MRRYSGTNRGRSRGIGRWLFVCAACLLTLGGGSGVALAISGSNSVISPKEAPRGPSTIGPAEVQGANTSGVGSPIAAGLLPEGTPPPVGPEVIEVSNAWEVSNGSSLVAVYAGSAGNEPSSGRFVIIRQSFPAGTQSIKTVTVPGSGALTISKAPTGSASETTAQTGRLEYNSTSGSSGILDLGTDTTTQG